MRFVIFIEYPTTLHIYNKHIIVTVLKMTSNTDSLAVEHILSLSIKFISYKF
jgi:hypothetical protein